MDIYPAIDLKDGQCVRLTQGDFATATIYESDPLAQAKKFVEAGATWLHIVDLDGARLGEMQQFDAIAAIASQTKLKIQAGGGLRHERVVEQVLGLGVERVVIGSLAVKNKRLVADWLHKFGPERIVLAFDIRLKDNEPEILTHGWQSGSQQLLWDVLDAYAESGLKTVLCTDVSRDGMLTGTNLDLYRIMRERWPTLDVLASGGVSGMDDLIELTKIGTVGAIVGKAIYEGRIDLKDALTQVKNAR